MTQCGTGRVKVAALQAPFQSTCSNVLDFVINMAVKFKSNV